MLGWLHIHFSKNILQVVPEQAFSPSQKHIWKTSNFSEKQAFSLFKELEILNNMNINCMQMCDATPRFSSAPL